MNKELRSLINEFFPLELRVELELLSRKRDILNKEKQDELIKLLRKYQIKDISLLGSGTNRYAFKFHGYAIKFATDQDGRIDNLTEFKMAKYLYPLVIKIHEISKNGTLLVTEYIQPFDSFGEMQMHRDQIVKILQDLSSQYLIGDVGISSKNFRNWGKRLNSNAPVCLDFAYVYDVKSKLFVCSNCNQNSMLRSDETFTRLVCPNKDCRSVFLFEDIRRKISNKEHYDNIKNIEEDGYYMETSSKVFTLNPDKSIYLKELNKMNEAKKKVKKSKCISLKEEIQYEDIKDTFKMEA